MLKIVEIIPILSVRRGAETFFVNLCEELSKRDDIELRVIVLYNNIIASFSNQFNKLNIKPIFCHKHKGIDFKAAKILKTVLKEINPDIIHTHNCCLLTYFLAFGFKKQNWKYFHTCHSIPSIEAVSKEHFLRKKFAKKHLMTNIAISPIIKDEFEKAYKLNNIPVVVNGIPLTFFDKKIKKYDFIMVASFDEVKNYSLLIDAFKILVEKKKDLKLICLGDGPTYSFIVEKVKDLGLEKNVSLPGARDDVGIFLNESKIFVLSSKYEGIPISILEAMNFGLPVIATNVGGISNIITEGRNGLLVESGNTNELAKAMLSLLEDEDLYNNISKNNLIDIKNHSINKCADQYIEIFKSEI